ncbi:MAG TPA: ABC transporter ATP-binding protein [Massilibacterium sp.]|nr:ABC transporter ATP-binding protein [Massilibacterium sp.]
MTFLHVDSVSHSFFSKKEVTHVLKNLSLQVKKGTFISILGPSGCGKSTLLSIISGILTPTNGKVNMLNQEVKKPSLQIGYMLQQDYLFPWKSIEDNISLGLMIQKRPKKEKAYALQLLEEVGLAHTLKKYPHELSGGMRQRIAFVRTLATNPSLLLLDEPFSALDFTTKLKLEHLVWSMLKQYEKTAILVTHDLEEAIAMSDEIFILSKRPSSVAKKLTPPSSILHLAPLEARKHPDFLPFFTQLWEEMQNNENL